MAHLNYLKKMKRCFQKISMAWVGLLPRTSHATTIESVLNKTVSLLQGSIARNLVILAIIGTGYMCIFQQRFPKQVFISVLIGAGIIFGASMIYSSTVG